MKHFQFFLGFVFGLMLITACAALKYKYYGLDLPAPCYDDGTLLGKAPNDKDWPDLSFTQCKPDAQVKGKCVIQKSSDFFSKDKDLKECQQALSDCQRGQSP